MFFNTLAETTILEDANFIFTKLIVPYSFIEFILTIIIFGGAIFLYIYSEMPVKKAVGSFFTLLAVFYTVKWGIYHYEMPASGVAEGYSKAEGIFIWTLLVWVITKIARWFNGM